MTLYPFLFTFGIVKTRKCTKGSDSQNMLGITWFINELNFLWIQFVPLESGHSSKFSEDRHFRKCIQSPRWPFLITVNKLQIDKLAECFNRFFGERVVLTFHNPPGVCRAWCPLFCWFIGLCLLQIHSGITSGKVVTKDSIKAYIPRTPQALLGLISSVNFNRLIEPKNHSTEQKRKWQVTALGSNKYKHLNNHKWVQESTGWSPQKSCGAWSQVL